MPSTTVAIFNATNEGSLSNLPTTTDNSERLVYTRWDGLVIRIRRLVQKDFHFYGNERYLFTYSTEEEFHEVEVLWGKIAATRRQIQSDAPIAAKLFVSEKAWNAELLSQMFGWKPITISEQASIDAAVEDLCRDLFLWPMMGRWISNLLAPQINTSEQTESRSIIQYLKNLGNYKTSKGVTERLSDLHQGNHAIQVYELEILSEEDQRHLLPPSVSNLSRKKLTRLRNKPSSILNVHKSTVINDMPCQAGPLRSMANTETKSTMQSTTGLTRPLPAAQIPGQLAKTWRQGCSHQEWNSTNDYDDQDFSWPS